MVEMMKSERCERYEAPQPPTSQQPQQASQSFTPHHHILPPHHSSQQQSNHVSGLQQGHPLHQSLPRGPMPPNANANSQATMQRPPAPPIAHQNGMNGVTVVQNGAPPTAPLNPSTELNFSDPENEKWWWVCCLEFCFCLL